MIHHPLCLMSDKKTIDVCICDRLRAALDQAGEAIDHERSQLANWGSAETEAALSVWPGDGPTVAEWLAVQTGLGRAVQIIKRSQDA
jgi:hypothetical protein